MLLYTEGAQLFVKRTQIHQFQSPHELRPTISLFCYDVPRKHNCHKALFIRTKNSSLGLPRHTYGDLTHITKSVPFSLLVYTLLDYDHFSHDHIYSVTNASPGYGWLFSSLTLPWSDLRLPHLMVLDSDQLSHNRIHKLLTRFPVSVTLSYSSLLLLPVLLASDHSSLVLITNTAKVFPGFRWLFSSLSLT